MLHLWEISRFKIHLCMFSLRIVENWRSCNICRQQAQVTRCVLSVQGFRESWVECRRLPELSAPRASATPLRHPDLSLSDSETRWWHSIAEAKGTSNRIMWRHGRLNHLTKFHFNLLIYYSWHVASLFCFSNPCYQSDIIRAGKIHAASSVKQFCTFSKNQQVNSQISVNTCTSQELLLLSFVRLSDKAFPLSILILIT